MDRRSRQLLVAKLALLVVSMLVCVVFAEGVLRLTLNPVNFLRPVLIDDPLLGHHVKPGTGGHDRWGLRNESVPDRVDIVAIGDSQTYGVSAMAFNSWPAWLSRLNDRSVYNMALGGWGPIQYEYLARERALELDPETIILSLYLGNDIYDSYRVVYGLEEWSDRRLPGEESLLYDYLSVEQPPGATVPVLVRTWIGRHSILYRLVVSTLGQMLGRLELKVRKLGPSITVLDDGDLTTAFTPGRRLKGVDLDTPEVREGLRLSLDVFERIIALCEQNGIRLLVVAVPTKESVFEEELMGRSELDSAEAIERLLVGVTRLRGLLGTFFESRGIPFIDPRDALRRAGAKGAIYPSNEGGHPVSAGYRAIAETIAIELD